MEIEWRLLPLRTDDAFMAMATDEALLRLNAKGKSPNTIRFWRWRPSAISIGYFQSAEDEVDLERAKSYGVDVVRRITGGGAVFHDYNGELTYSVVCRQDDVSNDILESYEFICSGLVSGLKRLGLRARPALADPFCSAITEFKRVGTGRFKPISDVQIDGKRISGSAQTRRWGSVLQHGTVLISPDVRRMLELLKVRPEKISDEFIASVFERVTTVERELGKKPGFDEVAAAMRAGFEQALGVELIDGDLTTEEMKLATELKPKYASDEWLRKR